MILSPTIGCQIVDDERAAREGRSRSALIRDAIDNYMYDERSAEIDRHIVEAYERMPEEEWELAGVDAEMRELIEAEPWWTGATSAGQSCPLPAAGRSWC